VNFLADENVDASIIAGLRAEGHKVQSVAELNRAIDDDAVLTLANETQSVLLTEDKDFGLLVYRQKKVHCGVVLLRLSGLSSDTKSDVVRNSIREHSSQIERAFSVISPAFMRIRTP
jgi:predicted nuclease of predicted toxin-antitoxin system